MLTEGELERYQRQIRIFGKEGQEKLKRAKVFIAGAGGLGSAVSIYLVSAGIGRIRIVDQGIIELSNLNRQILYRDAGVGCEKAKCAEEELQRINPNVGVEAISATIKKDNADELIGNFDMIVDAMDNFPTRYLLNEVALAKNIPLFHGAVEGFYGQTTTIIPGKTACLACVFPESPPQRTWPMVSVTCGIMGCIQSTEVIKYILGMGSLLENKLLMVDGLNAKIEEIILERNPDCKVCSKVRKIL